MELRVKRTRGNFTVLSSQVFKAFSGAATSFGCRHSQITIQESDCYLRLAARSCQMTHLVVRAGCKASARLRPTCAPVGSAACAWEPIALTRADQYAKPIRSNTLAPGRCGNFHSHPSLRSR